MENIWDRTPAELDLIKILILLIINLTIRYLPILILMEKGTISIIILIIIIQKVIMISMMFPRIRMVIDSIELNVIILIILILI
mgnify:CR=1 FL=1